MLEDAHAFLLEQHAVRILPNLGAFHAELNRLQQRLAEASTWAAGVDPLPLSWSLAVVDPRLVQARVFLSQRRLANLDQAAQLLAQLRAFCERVPNRRLLMEVEALEGILLAHRGDNERALDTLERVVLKAEANGWVRLFVDMGSEMAILLTELEARGVAPHYLAQVLAAFSVGPPMTVAEPNNGQDQLMEPLSERELEVLALLAQRYTNKEIAAQLFIAPATVKHHTISIYRKLDAGDRRQAVDLANALGLLSMSA